MKQYDLNKTFNNDFDSYERYYALAAAILQQAVYDYKKIAARKAPTLQLKKSQQSELKTIERFFLSNYGQMLSYNHGEYIVERLHKECDKLKQNK